MAIYVGIGSAAKNVTSIYCGVGGAAKSVSAVYVGVGGVAKQVFPDGAYGDNYECYNSTAGSGFVDYGYYSNTQNSTPSRASTAGYLATSSSYKWVSTTQSNYGNGFIPTRNSMIDTTGYKYIQIKGIWSTYLSGSECSGSSFKVYINPFLAYSTSSATSAVKNDTIQSVGTYTTVPATGSDTTGYYYIWDISALNVTAYIKPGWYAYDNSSDSDHSYNIMFKFSSWTLHCTSSTLSTSNIMNNSFVWS